MTKKILFLVTIIITLFSCKEKVKKVEKPKEKIRNYIIFSGKITNKNSRSITISNKKSNFKKVIKVSKKGIFKDSLNIEYPSFLTLTDGTEYALLYLKGGDDVSMTVDAKLFDKSIKFSGKGYKETKFLNKKFLLRSEFLKDDAIYHISKKSFTDKINEFQKTFLKELKKTKTKDKEFFFQQEKELEKFQKNIKRTFKLKSSNRKKLKAGTPTPEFSKPYESTTGKKYSLKDFKGKYVYLEFWTTWCGNCEKQHPHTNKLAEKFKNKNIQFVGISIDYKSDYKKWKDTSKKYNLSGIQLYYNEDSAFSKKYNISEIPRFIIIDPQGNIVDADAPKPSNPKTIEVFNNLLGL